MIFYHGQDVKFKGFDITKIKDGGTGDENIDQEGVGFYFTNSYIDSLGYAGHSGYVVEVDIDITKKGIITSKSTMTEAKVARLLKMAPKLNLTLTDWAENRIEAFTAILDATAGSFDTTHEVLQAVWYEAYRHEHIKFLQNIVKMGFVGSLIKKQSKIQHIIMYNTKDIKVIKIYDIKNGDRKIT